MSDESGSCVEILLRNGPEAKPNSHYMDHFLGSHSHPTAEETLGTVTRTSKQGFRFGPRFGPHYQRPFKLNVILNFNTVTFLSSCFKPKCLLL